MRKACDSVDHGCLRMFIWVHRFPECVCDIVSKLCGCWNTRILANTKLGLEMSDLKPTTPSVI